jgi:hypothetical protein
MSQQDPLELPGASSLVLESELGLDYNQELEIPDSQAVSSVSAPVLSGGRAEPLSRSGPALKTKAELLEFYGSTARVLRLYC